MCPNCTRGLTEKGEVCPQCGGTGFWNPQSLSVEQVKVMQEAETPVAPVETPVEQPAPEAAPVEAPVEPAPAPEAAPVEPAPEAAPAEVVPPTDAPAQ